MLIICAVLVSYVSSQNGEFIIVSHIRLLCVPYGFVEEFFLQVTLVHVLLCSAKFWQGKTLWRI